MYIQSFIKSLFVYPVVRQNMNVHNSLPQSVQIRSIESKSMMTCEYPNPVCPPDTFCMKIIGKTGVCVVMKD